MSNFRALITNFTPGSAKQVEFIILAPPTGVAATAATFMVKSRASDDDTDAIIEKSITTGDVSGTGQITDAGGDTITVRVDLTSVDTLLIGMARMSFYLSITLDTFPTPYIPFVGMIAANAKSVVS